MELNKKQKKELQSHGYDPCVRHFDLYPEDFMMDLDVWKQVLQCLNLNKANNGVVLAVVGVKVKDEV